jgi:hypothetical protein
VQGDRLVGIGVRHTVDAFAHAADDVELLVELAAQRFAVSLRGKRFATGKLPVPGEMRAVQPESEKKPVLSLDDGGNHDGID